MQKHCERKPTGAMFGVVSVTVDVNLFPFRILFEAKSIQSTTSNFEQVKYVSKE